MEEPEAHLQTRRSLRTNILETAARLTDKHHWLCEGDLMFKLIYVVNLKRPTTSSMNPLPFPLKGSRLRVKAVGVAELKRPTDTERRSKISITHQAFVRFVRRPSAASRALEEPDSRALPENPAPLLFCAAITARLTDERLSVKSGLSVSECARLCRCQLR